MAFALVAVTPVAGWAQAGIPYLAEPDPPPEAKDKTTTPGGADSEAPTGTAPSVDAPASGAAPADGSAGVTAAPAPAVEETAGRPFEFFADLWSRRRAALGRGDLQEAARVLATLVEAKLAAGWPDIFVYGDALARESETALTAGNARAAVVLATAAAALAPHRPGTHFALARAQRTAGAGLGTIVGAYWRGLVVAVSEPPLVRVLAGNLLVALTLSLLTAVAALVAVILYRHSRLLFHDLRHVLPRGTTRFQAVLLGSALLLTPVFVRMGAAWSVLAWLVVLAPYYEQRERLGAVIAAAVLAASAFGLPLIISHFAYAGSRSQDVYLTVRDAGATAAAERVKNRRRLGPEELHALGLRVRWSGRVLEARDWLDRAAAALADEDLLVTAGNVRYLAGDRAAAIAAYEQALRVDPENVPALFNLSRVHYALAEHQKAGEQHRRAMAVDYEWVERLNEEAKRASSTYLVDGGVPRRLLDLPAEHGRLHARTIAQIWNEVGGTTTRLTFATWAAVATVFIAAAGGVRRLVRPARLCLRCGFAACRRCNPEMPDQNQCGQCYHAFIDRQDVDPQACIRKEIQTHRYRARQTRMRQVFSILLAGSGQLLRGAFLRGMLLMAGFVGLGLVLLTALGTIPEIVPSEPLPRPLAVGLAASVMVVLYAVALLDGLREDR